METHLFGSNRPVPKEIYERIKKLEDHILLLEGLSPEYFTLGQTLLNTSQRTKGSKIIDNRKQFDLEREELVSSLSSINQQIHELRSSLNAK